MPTLTADSGNNYITEPNHATQFVPPQPGDYTLIGLEGNDTLVASTNF